MPQPWRLFKKDEAVLPQQAELETVRIALSMAPNAVHFPVVDASGRCCGLVPRGRLETASQAVMRHQPKGVEPDGKAQAVAPAVQDNGSLAMRLGVNHAVSHAVTALCAASQAGLGNSSKVPLFRIMDPAPFTLLEDIPVRRVYPLYVSGSVSAAVLINKRGEYRGILARKDLIGGERNEIANQAGVEISPRTTQVVSPRSGQSPLRVHDRSSPMQSQDRSQEHKSLKKIEVEIIDNGV